MGNLAILIGNRIKQIRKERNLRQEIAKDPKKWSYLEHGTKMHSVNFPTAESIPADNVHTGRFDND